jgi:FAD/FMN-containing dehydrogenase/Fe-S oxidoreductase
MAQTLEKAMKAGEGRRADPFPEWRKLERELASVLKGDVGFDPGMRALYATDASNYRQPPIGVVFPRDRDDIAAVHRICRSFGAPILSRGGGTSVAGQCTNAAVVMDLTRHFNRVLAVDPANRTATVESGIVLDELQKAVAPHGLIFGPNPATHSRCAVGGMIGNNACGVNSVMAAFRGNGPRTSDNIRSLEVMTYDGAVFNVGRTSDEELREIIAGGGRRGEIYSGLRKLRDEFADLIRARYPKIPRRVSGYNLDDLLPEKGFDLARALGGSEGTCVTILTATLELVSRPRHRGVLAIGYPDAFLAGNEVVDILPFKPIGLEGIDRQLVENMQEHGMHPEAVAFLPSGGGWLLVEFGGDTPDDCRDQAGRVMEMLRTRSRAQDMRYCGDPEDVAKIWRARESGLGATAFVKNKRDTWEGWEDSAVAPERVGEYLRELKACFHRYGYNPALYGHFGQGCIHCRAEFDLVSTEGIAHYRAFLDEAADLVVRFGGSLSGEHGDGQARAELLPKMFGPELVVAFQRFKGIWDPDWKMNPGKVVKPNAITANLRLGADYDPWRPKTHFSYPDDRGDFSRAVLRCVGVGECRRHENGTMCPSYMVTREERHSTRGRTHLLFEMLNGDLVKEGFRSEIVKEALDLCFACKGCKGECPAHVDVATYKAEFLAHYYRGRLRPIHAYAFGLSPRWARLASIAPGLANFFQRSPVLSPLVKKLLGIAPQRTIPRLAPESFKKWFFRRKKMQSGRPVILWPDTFNNHYHPEVARAAAEFLEDSGWGVRVPRAALCCGRPLYDYGMLATAKAWLRRIVEELRPDIRAGIPVVGLEPSCVAVFRDELVNLFPDDDDARRLSKQTFLLSEFIEKEMPGQPMPRLARRAVVHGHCHQKAVMKMTSEERVLRRLGVDFDPFDAGCCGMAGAFGFEKEHYDISVQCGERMLLPKIREASADTLIVANGFSCREQIEQTTGRRVHHLAELIALARKKQ